MTHGQVRGDGDGLVRNVVHKSFKSAARGETLDSSDYVHGHPPTC